MAAVSGETPLPEQGSEPGFRRGQVESVDDHCRKTLVALSQSPS
jgi:hypothetical protein